MISLLPTTNDNNNTSTSTSTMTVDVAMIKIDVQGAEPLVLRGMKNLLKRSVDLSDTYLF